MKLIQHIIFVDLNDNEKIIINSLNGTMDKITNDTFEILSKWQKCENIIPVNDIEECLYEVLQSKGYLVNHFNEEMIMKDEIIKVLRKNHLKDKEKCKHITFIMTYDCNFRCPYCFEGEYHMKKKVISPILIDAALKLAGDSLESIGLFGGEPLLPKNRKSIEYLLSKTIGSAFSIITNGFYLLEYFDLLKKINVSSIMVTLDGKEKTHNKRRFLADGKPTFKKIMFGVEKCLENNISICIRMNLDGSNFEEANDLKNQLLNQYSKYNKLLSFEMSPMIYASSLEQNQVNINLQNSDALYSYKERRQRNQYSKKFSPILNAITVGEKIKPLYSFCYAHQNLLLVDPYGKIYPCIPAVGNEPLAIGEYYPQIHFKENSIYNRNIEKIPKCRACIYSLLCGGGCPLGLLEYEDFFKPQCFSIHNQIHNLLPEFYKIQRKNKGDVTA